MTPDELRQAYLTFFQERGHAILPSAALIPDNDPTTLFTGSGMQPLLPYFLGQPHPKGTRVADSQKCFRSQDIEEVGDNRHTTFFEMLGNWSFGDYFKEEQLNWIFTFFTEVCGLDPHRLFVSVYGGNEELGIPRDEEAAQIWQNLFRQKGIEAPIQNNLETPTLGDGRIFYYGNSNWWSRVGAPENMPTGEPGGPDSEVFYDFGETAGFHQRSEFADQSCHINCDCGRFLEIGNSVFMTYVKTDQGFEELENKNIDFGGGFVRILAAMNQDPDVFKTEVFQPIIRHLEKISAHSYGDDPQVSRSFRVIADHIRAAVMLAADGVFPSNKEQGYFSRRLIRRAIRYGQMIGVKGEFVKELVPIVCQMYQQAYPQVVQQQQIIEDRFAQEEQRFQRTLEKGLHQFDKLVDKALTAEQAFTLYETYGFPLEMSIEEAESKNIKIAANIDQTFTQLKKQHARESRQASQGKFKGGLLDQSEVTVKYHTATHLLHAALRKILGEHVQQMGSNITSKRLRFDFSHPEAVTDQQLHQVEDQINQWITSDLPVIRQVISKQKALDSGAIAFFLEKYPDEVSVYTIGTDPDSEWISKEFCGGPHVSHTGEIGTIELYKEQSSGSGVRRVYARLRT